MTKKVFIGVLAALMLFAFVACENQVPTYREVSYISVEKVQDVISGQPFVGSMVNVIVHYTDGGVESVSGAGYVSADDSVDTTKAFSVTAKYAGKTADYTILPVDPVSAVITADEVKSIAENPEADDAATREVTLGKWVAVISGGTNGSYTVSSDNAGDYSVTAAKLVADEIREAGTYQKALAITYDGDALSTESTVTVVVPSAIEPTVATKVVPFYTIGEKEYTTLPQLFIGDAVEVAFYTVDAEGEKTSATPVTISEASSNGAVTAETAYVLSNTGFGTATSNVFTVNVTDETKASISIAYYTEDGERWTANAAVGAGVDCITDITSVATVGTGLPEGTLSASNIVVTGTTLAKSEGHAFGKDDPSYSITFDETYTIPASTADNGVDVFLTVTYTGRDGKSVAERYVITDVKAAPAE